MRIFDFSKWTERDVLENTLTGGGLTGEKLRLIADGSQTVFGLFGRTNQGHRVKFMEALEDATAGNEYRISARVKLGEGCSTDRADVAIGVMDFFSLTPTYLHSTEVSKTAWTTVEFTYTLTNDDHSAISIEQSGQAALAEELLVADIKTELLYRAPREAREVDNRKTLWLIGDSITCEYKPSVTTRGWGMYIGDLLDDSRIRVKNYARAGLSTQSFIRTDGLSIWTYVCRRMKEGDFLIVSLGINDCSSSSPLRRVSVEDYCANLVEFIEAAKRCGVTTLFVTSTVTVESNPVVNYRRAYPEAMLRVAAEKKAEGYAVDAIDLNTRMLEEIRKIEATEGYDYLVNTYFSIKGAADGSLVADTTHHREAGSRWVASMIADLLKQSESPLKEYCR